MSVFKRFHNNLQHAISAQLGWSSLRPVQEEAGQAILDGKNAIVLAPTAGGKTEASFFPVLSSLLENQEEGVQVIYVAPIKALLNNQAERLATYAGMVGLSRCVWHGDTSQSQRKRFLKEPDNILMTTPESLEVMCISGTINEKRLFRNLRFIIIDEIHALAGSDRGSHLRSVLSRIFSYSQYDVQRIGLSATVGNPEDILSWIGSDSEREGIVIHPPAPVGRKELAIVLREDEKILASEASTMAYGQKSLFFCQSRGFTEAIAKEMASRGVEVYVHHSSISKEERSRAEELFQKQGSACIVCTSTLELGIDIGDLDKVFQAEAPSTVSSFLQRMGRTGRREGRTANTSFFCLSTESVLQSVALVELAKTGWVEPVQIHPRSWPVLVHQVIAMCLAQGGATVDTMWEQLQRVPDFSMITEAEYYRLIRYMLEKESLVSASGRLLVGTEVEKQFGKKNWMEIYAVFSSPQTYQVETKGKHPIGHLTQDFVDKLGKDGCFLLGGKAWLIESVSHQDRVLKVVPAPKGKEPTWGGFLPQFLGLELCQKIKEILLSKEPIPYLKGEAKQALESARENTDASLLHRLGSWVFVGERLLWWTYAGGIINSTLRHTLLALTGWKVTADNFKLTIQGLGATQSALQAWIEEMKTPEFWAQDEFWDPIRAGLPSYRLSKFQDLVPRWIEQEMLADYLLDLKATCKWLSDSPSQITDLRPVYFPTKHIASSPKKELFQYVRPPAPTNIQPSSESQLKLPIRWVETDEDLVEVLRLFSTSDVLGFDVETSIPPTTLCLVQLANRDFIALIDPLRISDLSPLKELIENQSIVKIIHNASFEQTQMRNQGIEVKNVYDTLKASRIIRGKQTTTGERIFHKLNYVCQRELNIAMDKGEQSSDWRTRPLTPSQLSYAALDAEVMLQLYDLFTKEQPYLFAKEAQFGLL